MDPVKKLKTKAGSEQLLLLFQKIMIERYVQCMDPGDPGYKSTAKLVCESALALARSNDLPGGEGYGGVLTSAVGLGEVLVNRLKDTEIEFKVLN